MNQLVWYKNDGTPRDGEWEQTIISNTLNKAWALDLADMDNDADLDVVATSNEPNNKYGVFWFENVNITDNLQPGNGSSWTPHRIDSESSSYRIYKPESLKVADIDNDGDNDTIVGSNHNSKGGIYWFENSNGKATVWNNYTIFHLASANGAVRDIDVKNINHTASTRKDVAATLYNQQYVAWFENDGDPVNTVGNWKRHNIFNRQYPNSIAIGDINNDNKNDVIRHQRILQLLARGALTTAVVGSGMLLMWRLRRSITIITWMWLLLLMIGIIFIGLEILMARALVLAVIVLNTILTARVA
jgi:hypothetical protein